VTEKILIVEDNELNLKLFCDLLRAHGYTAEPVRDGREAVERARAFSPDLVVMDIQMPWISGLELIEQMKGDEGLRRTPIMAVTAYAAKGDEDRIRAAGAEGYVSKPISVMKFVAAVRELLEAATRVEEPEETQAEWPEETDEEAGEPAQEADAAPDRHPGEGRGLPEEESRQASRDPGLRRDDEIPSDAERPESAAPDAEQVETPAGELRLPDAVPEGEEPPRLI
jgi:two-component system cell cycle response regulator DivK